MEQLARPVLLVNKEKLEIEDLLVILVSRVLQVVLEELV